MSPKHSCAFLQVHRTFCFYRKIRGLSKARRITIQFHILIRPSRYIICTTVTPASPSHKRRYLPERFDAGVLVLVDAEVLPLEEAATAVAAHELPPLVGAAVLLIAVQRAQVLTASRHRAPAPKRPQALDGYRIKSLLTATSYLEQYKQKFCIITMTLHK